MLDPNFFDSKQSIDRYVKELEKIIRDLPEGRRKYNFEVELRSYKAIQDLMRE